MKNQDELTNYESLDDIGFVGGQDSEFTEDDRNFLRNFFAERKTSHIIKHTAHMPTRQVAYA